VDGRNAEPDLGCPPSCTGLCDTEPVLRGTFSPAGPRPTRRTVARTASGRRDGLAFSETRRSVLPKAQRPRVVKPGVGLVGQTRSSECQGNLSCVLAVPAGFTRDPTRAVEPARAACQKPPRTHPIGLRGGRLCTAQATGRRQPMPCARRCACAATIMPAIGSIWPRLSTIWGRKSR